MKNKIGWWWVHPLIALMIAANMFVFIWMMKAR
jgi:hypothetical protein